eukprot:SAG11_NODE_803_length_7098_cov_10.219174_2_plen_61_part_00
MAEAAAHEAELAAVASEMRKLRRQVNAASRLAFPPPPFAASDRSGSTHSRRERGRNGGEG